MTDPSHPVLCLATSNGSPCQSIQQPPNPQSLPPIPPNQDPPPPPPALPSYLYCPLTAPLTATLPDGGKYPAIPRPGESLSRPPLSHHRGVQTLHIPVLGERLSHPPPASLPLDAAAAAATTIGLMLVTHHLISLTFPPLPDSLLSSESPDLPSRHPRRA